MRTEKIIKEKIKEIENAYAHVLRGEYSTIVENAPRALMQLQATAQLEGLYFALGKTRPSYESEKSKI